MHVGMASIFQNPGNAGGVSDYAIYQQDLALAFAAEGLGFESVWGVEHHFTDYTMTPDPVQFLAAVGGHSKKVKLGTMVIVLPWNDPMRVAEKVSMLDCMTDGRVILGIGRGLGRVEFEGFRVDMNESRERFVESAEMVLNGLENGYCEYDGKHIKQPRARIRPEPFRSFKNRTYAASVSPESCSLMAKLGVGILVIPQKTWEEHAADLDDYNTVYRQTHGVDAPPPYVAGWVACDKDPGRAEEMARKYIVGYWQSVVKHYEMQSSHFESTKGYEYYKKLNETIEEHGVDGMAEFFLDLQIWGTPEQCYEKIKTVHTRMNCCGFTGIFSYAGMPERTAVNNMELFAREVMPELKKLGERPAFDTDNEQAPAFLRAVG
ncbi:MAG: LLM class flavin-dependent oxidoreductase [Gammaproteobacteria bacterium]|jgi:alkanesulfonate monooxygenase SsuD/methylene tetrahydromethanopterin reductase-like flavin-dependent oxidoreductase (luciferase family)